ncbi:exodeoxyribonuclease V subunit alpha [Marinicella sp. S1101]|uniref:exodeoxyribonuclease V subunit alpha n=1 Tax=Marinicella marina TaxID=2996016 RepID=UPI002260998D|nr:exodeoxyribonuclease V subunit alpha [Marinicella marina]MCX7553487.1 exodeoxyribonuclease V subunit alpha [Marinicella marina]MDJ1140111.1 exodeoxyribonuclease V subunit alpha [Marinicella marina]
MKPVITANYLQKCFNAFDFDWLWLQENLQLDLAHIQFLRDFQMGWSDTDQRLLLALLFLVDAVNQGSLCLLLNDKKLKACSKRNGISDVESHLKSLNLNQYQLHAKDILVVEDDRLYFQKHHHQQTLLQRDLSALITHSEVKVFARTAIKQAVDRVVGGLSYQLESQQIQALLTAVLQPFSIISGGPGTGKTTILLSLLNVMNLLGVAPDKIALAAPTGRAANRMTESIENGLNQTSDSALQNVTALSATTIHRLLGSNPQLKRPRFHANNHLAFDLVVVDEVSMVDLELMNQLIQAIGPSTRLVFLGDQFQLPSVQSGALLADLMPPIDYGGLHTAEFLAVLAELWPSTGLSMVSQPIANDVQLLTDKVTVLAVSKRFEPHIAALSEQVRMGDAASFINTVHTLKHNNLDVATKTNHSMGVYWYGMAMDHQRWLKLCRDWYVKYYLSHSSEHANFVDAVKALRYQSLSHQQQQKRLPMVFTAIKSQRILTLTHAGMTGTEQINALIAGWLKRDLNIETFGACFHGAVIMIKRNDATLGLFNGDVGLVIEVAANQFQVYFEGAEGYQAYSIHLIPDHVLAFAMTVHKSQGSEFEHVLIPLTEQLDNPLLSREIIYTGMTRAKKSVIFYGSEAALKKAIQQKTVRNSGLTFWYNVSH